MHFPHRKYNILIGFVSVQKFYISHRKLFFVMEPYSHWTFCIIVNTSLEGD